MKIFAALLLGGFLVTIATGSVVGQQGEIKSIKAAYHPVKAGEYRELTTLRKIKFFLTPYVAPYAMKDISIVYSYDPKSFTELDWGELQPYMKNGAVVPMNYTGGVWKTYKSPMLSMAIMEKMGLNVRFVSYDGAFLGRKPEGQLVSWESTDPYDPN